MKLYLIKVKNAELYIKVQTEIPMQIVLTTQKYATPFFEKSENFIKEIINDFKNQNIAELETLEFEQKNTIWHH